MPSDASPLTDCWVGLVDDDPSIRRALTRMLLSHGITAKAFGSAEEYLGREPGAEPCCLVLDIHLSGLSGLELQERLAAGGTPPPIVFITAADGIPAAQLERRLGVHGFLRKPFAADELLGLVCQHCGVLVNELAG